MTAAAPSHFWELPDFTNFVPHLRAQPAHDKRHGAHSRLELASSAPWPLVARALEFRGPCAECGREIAPFRARAAESKRGRAVRGVFLAVTCRLQDRLACSRGRRAAAGYDAIETLIAEHDGGQAVPKQEALL